MWWYDAVDGRVSADRGAFRALLAERDALVARVLELETVAVAAQKAIHAERNYSLNAYEDAMETLGAAVDALAPATATEGGKPA
jgi:anti-sigma factor RsiW